MCDIYMLCFLSQWLLEVKWDFCNMLVVVQYNYYEYYVFFDVVFVVFIDCYLCDLCDFCMMGEDVIDWDSWCVGDLGDLFGEQLIEVVCNGKLWINLCYVMDCDLEYCLIYDVMLDDMCKVDLSFKLFFVEVGILIFLLMVQVFCYFDVFEIMLWYMCGVKCFWIYLL